MDMLAALRRAKRLRQQKLRQKHYLFAICDQFC
jgi:hypothetical protein